MENQYLSALSAHFAYWASPDVALLLLRAVHGLDVLTGGPAAAPDEPGEDAAAAAAAPAGGARGGGRLGREPTSPRQHLVALP